MGISTVRTAGALRGRGDRKPTCLISRTTSTSFGSEAQSLTVMAALTTKATQQTTVVTLYPVVLVNIGTHQTALRPSKESQTTGRTAHEAARAGSQQNGCCRSLATITGNDGLEDLSTPTTMAQQTS